MVLKGPELELVPQISFPKFSYPHPRYSITIFVLVKCVVWKNADLDSQKRNEFVINNSGYILSIHLHQNILLCKPKIIYTNGSQHCKKYRKYQYATHPCLSTFSCVMFRLFQTNLYVIKEVSDFSLWPKIPKPV